MPQVGSTMDTNYFASTTSSPIILGHFNKGMFLKHYIQRKSTVICFSKTIKKIILLIFNFYGKTKNENFKLQKIEIKFVIFFH